MSGKNSSCGPDIWTPSPSLSIHDHVTDSGVSLTNAASNGEVRKNFHACGRADEVYREDPRSVKNFAEPRALAGPMRQDHCCTSKSPCSSRDQMYGRRANFCGRRYAINLFEAADELPHVPAPADDGQ
jgi:hypothetical protein